MTIKYDPLPVTDWASSLAAEYEEERRNRAIWDEQRRARDKQAEAADPGVTALKVLESAIEFSGTAAKTVRDLKAKRAANQNKEIWSTSQANGWDLSTKIPDLIQARAERREKLDSGEFEAHDERVSVRKLLAKKWKLGEDDASINYVMDLTGGRLIQAQILAGQQALEKINNTWQQQGPNGEPSYSELVSKENPISTQLGKMKQDVFGPGGLNMSTAMMDKYIRPGWDNFALTIQGASKVAKNKASRTASTMEAANTLQVGINAGTGGTTFLNQLDIVTAATAGPDGKVDPKKGLSIMAKRLEGIATSGTTTPTAFDDILDTTFVAGPNNKFKEGTNVSIRQLMKSNGVDVDAMETANDVAWGTKADAERIGKAKAIENEGLQLAADPNNLKLPDGQLIDLIGEKQKEYITVNGKPSERLAKIMEADPSESNINFWKGEINKALAAGKPTRALKLLEDSGLPVLEAEMRTDLVIQESVRKNQDIDGKVAGGSAKLVMSNIEDWDGLVPVSGGEALVYNELHVGVYEKALTEAAANPETRSQAVNIANEKRNAEWTREGGGLVAGNLDPNDPRRYGKYVWFSTTGPNGEPPGYRNHETYRAGKTKATKNINKKLSPVERHNLYNKVDTVLAQSGWVLGKSHSGQSIAKAITEHGWQITPPTTLLGMKQFGHLDEATLRVCEYLQIDPLKYIQAVTVSTVNQAKTDPKLAKIVGQYDLDNWLTDDLTIKDKNIDNEDILVQPFRVSKGAMDKGDIVNYMRVYSENLKSALGEKKYLIKDLYKQPSENVIKQAVLYASNQNPEILKALYPNMIDQNTGIPRMPYRFRMEVNKAKKQKKWEPPKETIQTVPENPNMEGYEDTEQNPVTGDYG